MTKFSEKLECYLTFILCVLLFSTSVANQQIGNMNKLQIPFIANIGQIDESIDYYARIFCANVAINQKGEIIYSINDTANGNIVFTESIVDGLDFELLPGKISSTKINFFKGNDPGYWTQEIPSYDVLSFGYIYDGIELKMKAYGNNVEKLFYVHPGASYKNILLKLEGADQIQINARGELDITTGTRNTSFTRPVAYQEISGKKIEVEVAYILDNNEYGFEVGEYDKNYTLIIDPLLASTYIGGSSVEGGEEYWWVWTDLGPDNSVYVAGMTASDDFPIISGSYEDDHKGDHDLFISKFSSDLSSLEACTYIGGSGFDQLWSLTAAENGNVYISGITHSINYPTTTDAYDRNKSGLGDGFISILSGDLSTLHASTFLGGSGYEFRVAVALDDADNIFVVGTTDNGTFPKTSGAFDEIYDANTDFFVSKFNNNLTSLLASTFLGGIYREDYPVIAIDENNNVYIAGTTGSSNYPTSIGAYNESINGAPGNDWDNLDVCVTKLSDDLSTLLASTFYGAEGYESGLHICLDDESNVYTCGHTWNPNFPVTTGVIDEVFSGDEYHITKFNSDLSNRLASTFLTPDDAGGAGIYDLKTDNSGYLYMVGLTNVDDIYTTDNAYDNSYNGGVFDGIVMIITDDLTEIVYSSYIGGEGQDGSCSIEVDDNGEAIVAGYTGSSANFPISDSAAYNIYGGGVTDCFVTRFTFEQFTPVTEGPHLTNATRSSAVCWVDYNDDGFLDIYETNAIYPDDENNCLYENNGDGTFSQIFDLEIVNDDNFSGGANWADYDNDGDLDLFVYAHRTHPNLLYINNGDGSFNLDESTPLDDSTVGSTSANWVDFNNDGDIDLFIGNSTCGPCTGYPQYRNFLFENSEGIFTEITEGDIVNIIKHTYGATWCDYDNDGDADLIDPNRTDENVDLFRNDGDNSFTQITSEIFTTSTGYEWQSTWADYDNDGDMDLYLGGATPGINHIFDNNGDGTFSESDHSDLGLFLNQSENGSWIDYDNDGDQDILIWSNNNFSPENSDSSIAYLFVNNNGQFTKMTQPLIYSDNTRMTAVVWGDYDRDGDLDLYVPMFLLNQAGAMNQFYENNGNVNNWITIKCIGTTSNKSAIGTRVRLKATINGNPVWQMRDITSKISADVQPPLEAHFGLGDAAIIDSIIVEWPSGIANVLTDISIDQFKTITESNCGDANGDVDVNVGDAVFIINNVFKGGPLPDPYENGDANCDGGVNVGDAVYIINIVFKGGPAPCTECL